MITILGAPVTKKNHQRLVWVKGRIIPIPSKPYVTWERHAIPQCRVQWFGQGHKTIVTPCALSAVFFRLRRTGDLGNYLAAVCDCLQSAGVVKDDKLIVSFDGSRLDWDLRNPRVEITIGEVATL